MKSGPRRRRNEMDKHRVPNLEEMNKEKVRRFLAELFSNLSAEEEYELRHEDYVMEMPQSGESIRGREKMREFQEAYPTPPAIQLRRVLVRDGLWVIEGVNDYGGGQVFDVVLIIELKDGKIWRDRRYYAEPFEAPEWRAQWVERMKA
jgi:SnoaL-like domain